MACGNLSSVPDLHELPHVHTFAENLGVLARECINLSPQTIYAGLSVPLMISRYMQFLYLNVFVPPKGDFL